MYNVVYLSKMNIYQRTLLSQNYFSYRDFFNSDEWDDIHTFLPHDGLPEALPSFTIDLIKDREDLVSLYQVLKIQYLI